MAGRSVGSIEITVTADTKRLKAQMVREGGVIGEATAEEIEAELSSLQGSLAEIDGSREAKILRKQIELALRDITATIDPDLDTAIARLREWRESEEARRLQIAIALDQKDVAEIATEIRAMTEEQKDIVFDGRLDMAEVEAEIEAIEAQQHRIEIGMDLDVSDLQRDFRAMRIATEAERWDITTRLRTGTFQAEVDRIRKEEEAEFLELRLALEKSLAEAQIAEFHAEVARRDAVVELELRTTRAAAEMATWRLEQQANEIGVELDLDLAAATVAFDAWLVRQSAKGIDVNVDPDTLRATIEFEAWIQAMQRQRIDVTVDPESAGASGKLAGDAAGAGFGSGWSSWLFDNQKLLVAAVGALGPDIAVVLEGLVSAGTAVASSAFSALGGAIGGLVPIIAGLVPAVTSLVVGFQGMGTSLGAVTKEFAAAVQEGRAFDFTAEDIQDSLKGLAPEAQRFVEAFADIFPQLDKIRQAVQGELFRGLDTALGQLADTTIPNIAKALETAAGSVNLLFRKLSDASQDIDFSGLMEGIRPAIDAVGDALVSLFESFEPLIKAATPAAKALADSFRTGAENLGEMIARGEATGALAKFFDEGIDSLKVWWELIRNVGDALFTVFQAGKTQGDSFVQSLADIVGRFDDWLESTAGQTALVDFFDTGARVMKAMVPILEGLQGLFEELVSPDSIGRLEGLTDALGRALPFLGQILDFIGRVGTVSTLVEAFARIGEALQPAVPALDRFADALGTILVGAIDALTPLVEGLGPLIGQIADALVPLAPPLVEIAQHFMELVTPLLLDNLRALGDVVTNLSPLVVDLLEAVMPLIDALSIPLIAALQLATPLLELMSEILITLKPVFDALIPVVEVFADVLSAINAPLKIFADVIKSTGITLGDLANPATAMGKVIHNVFTEDVHGASVIADEAAAKAENLARKIQLIVGAAGVAGAALEIQARQALAAGENLGGFAVNAELAAEAEDYFNTIAAEADVTPIIEVSDAIDSMEEAASNAKDSADALRESWDLLFGAAQRSQEAADAFASSIIDVSKRVEDHAQAVKDLRDAQDEANQSSVEGAEKVQEAESKLAEVRADEDSTAADITAAENDLADARRNQGDAAKESADKIADAKKALDENSLGIRGNSEAALENRDLLFGMMDAAIADAAALKENKASTEEVTETLAKHRRALIDQAIQLGASREEARAFVDQLNLTPENIDTLITASGLDTAEAGLARFKVKITDIDGTEIVVNTKAEGVEAVMAGLDGIVNTADDINRKIAKQVVATEGIPKTNAELQSAIDKANELDGKTSTVRVNIEVGGLTEGERRNLGIAVPVQHGGQARWGRTTIGGEAGPEFWRYGITRGIVTTPTIMPIGAQITSVAGTAALLRQLAGLVAPGGPRKQVNVVQNITPTQANPEMVAVSVLNRAAVLAN